MPRRISSCSSPGRVGSDAEMSALDDLAEVHDDDAAS
jgi:hypothetical protein